MLCCVPMGKLVLHRPAADWSIPSLNDAHSYFQLRLLNPILSYIHSTSPKLILQIPIIYKFLSSWCM